jgi:hypothetical protein
MRVGFVYEETMQYVGYERNMDLNSTFGEILEIVCDVFNWQANDFVFLMPNKISRVNTQWIPAEMGMTDQDYVKIYCVRKTNPLLLSF